MRPSGHDEGKNPGNAGVPQAERRKRLRGRGHDFEPVAAIAERHVAEAPAAAAMRDLEAVKKIWRDIAGDFICSNTSIASLRDGALTITAIATPFLFHLRSAKVNYIEQINARLRPGAVREIFYRIGPVKGEAAEESGLFEEARAIAKRGDITSFEIENIEVPSEVISSINDFVGSLKTGDAELDSKIAAAAVTIYKVTQYKKRHGYVECAVCSSLYFKRSEADNEARGAAGLPNDACEYCGFRITRMMAPAARRINERPWENFEAHSAAFPDTKFREFEYIRKREFEKARDEVDGLVKRFVMSEAPEDFAKLDRAIRLAMSLHGSFNYFEVKEFGPAKLDLMAELLGPNARAAFARGAMVAKF